MSNWMKDPKRRGYLALAILAVLVLSFLAPLVIGRDARHLSAYRDGAEDTSRLRAELSGKAALVQDVIATPHALDDTPSPSKTLFLAMGTERRYDADETASIVRFLRAGGNVILADEGGFGTDVARQAGFAFGSQRVLDTKGYNGDPKLVIATTSYGGQAYQLLFNSPSLLKNLPEATAFEYLVNSSAGAAFPDGSYLDTNGDGKVDQQDPAGPFPLVIRTHQLGGTLILVSDTGLFMNQQVALDPTKYRNADFLSALVGDMIPRDGTILIDESRHAPPFGLSLFDDAARALGRATSGLVIASIVILLLAGGSALAYFATRKTEDWSHHAHDIGAEVLSPESLRPDLARAQRMARRRISERYNIPMEQVAAMTAEALLRLCGDKLLADAAAGTLKSDPAPLFRTFSPSPQTHPEGSP